MSNPSDFGKWSDFWQFVADLHPKPGANYRLLRKDPFGPYSPENMEWRPKLPHDFTSPEGRAAYLRERRASVPGWSRDNDLRQRFGLESGEYDRMFKAQNGVCAICKQPEWVMHRSTGRVFSLGVDHDHETGAIRGLLCVNCNKAIGHAHDDPQRLRAAADYLEIHGATKKVVPFKKDVA